MIVSSRNVRSLAGWYAVSVWNCGNFTPGPVRLRNLEVSQHKDEECLSAKGDCCIGVLIDKISAWTNMIPVGKTRNLP